MFLLFLIFYSLVFSLFFSFLLSGGLVCTDKGWPPSCRGVAEISMPQILRDFHPVSSFHFASQTEEQVKHRGGHGEVLMGGHGSTSGGSQHRSIVGLMGNVGHKLHVDNFAVFAHHYHLPGQQAVLLHQHAVMACKGMEAII
jgi:hypothetical protein